MTSESTTDRTLRLRDGRVLGAQEVGPHDGPAIFHFHGHRSCRLEIQLIADAARRLGVRLIGLDRPGIGRSDARRGFRILDWPDEVQDAADQLGIDKFAVSGLSAGGIYALACAYKIPDRLTACGLISSAVPGDTITSAGPRWMKTMWLIGRRAPVLLTPLLLFLWRMSSASEPKVEAALTRWSHWLCEADQTVVANTNARATLVAIVAENARQIRKTNVREALSDFRPWGFAPEDVSFRNISMWHGEDDRIMPASLARLLAKALPHCAPTFYPREGHLSVLVRHADDILRRLSRPGLEESR
jgi:pimeloyl-ACP methyl ester carboxylesterase